MMNNTRQLVDAIVDGDTVRTQEKFNIAMQNRIASYLTKLRTDLSQSMFNKSTENKNE